MESIYRILETAIVSPCLEA